MTPILQFEQVRWTTDGTTPTPEPVMDVQLAAGDVLGIVYDEQDECPPIADLTAGLQAPVAGRVRFAAQCWTDRSPQAAAAARGRMRRIFAGPAWVSNLDMDENITLAERHHTRRPPEEIRAEAEALARRLGLPGLPLTRPAWTPRREQYLAQWVRALLGTPQLLLVEQPWTDFTTPAGQALWTEIKAKRAAGMAVVWLTTDAAAMNNDVLETSQWGRLQNGKWTYMA